jgi:hypothetical protein
VSRAFALASLSGLLLTGCPAPEPLPGEVQFVGSSDFDDPYVLDDGWTITLDQAFSGMAGFAATDPLTGDDLAREPGVALVDHGGGGNNELISAMDVPAGPFVASVRTVPVRDVAFGGLPVDVRDLMEAGSYVHWLRGYAHRDAQRIDFTWGFPLSHDLTGCSGLEVRSEELTRVTVHLESRRIFTTDLDDSSAPTGFTALAAADRNGNGELEQDELLRTLVTDAGLGADEDDMVLYRYLALATARALSVAGSTGCTVTER